MTAPGGKRIDGRYWPTFKALYVLAGLCPCSGLPFHCCPCAVADNDATGQGDEGSDAA